MADGPYPTWKNTLSTRYFGGMTVLWQLCGKGRSGEVGEGRVFNTVVIRAADPEQSETIVAQGGDINHGFVGLALAGPGHR
jgi:hypothetical protein